MTETNRQWRLRSRPVGMVKESDFELVEEPAPKVGEGQLLVRNLYLAFEPAMRGWLDDVKSYMPPVGIGEVMRASCVAQVVESRHPQFEAGALVHGMFGWQDYALTDAASRVPPGVPPERVLSVLGGTGLTAYFGMIDVGQPKAGDTVLVSGAAGATGSVAGQIARIQGASRVVGIAGGEHKCRWLTDELGFDAAIDYKSQDVRRRIRETCPDEIDVFFDNVGGEILDAALLNMKIGGRIALCGGISAYNEETLPPGPSNYMQLVIRRCTMQGFLLFDYLDRAREALVDLTKWLAEGRVKSAEDIQEGFENTPKTFLRLFEGQNLGKQLLKVADPPLG